MTVFSDPPISKVDAKMVRQLEDDALAALAKAAAAADAACRNETRSRVEESNAALMEGIGRRVTSLREAAGMDRAALADAAGISRIALAKVENGSTLRIESLMAIANGLGIPLAELMVNG